MHQAEKEYNKLCSFLDLFFGSLLHTGFQNAQDIQKLLSCVK